MDGLPSSSASDSAPADALAHALQTNFGASGPACWGPLQWMALHQIARGYPRENPTPAQQAALVAYVTSLVDLLPCSFCAKHWREMAPSIAAATGSRYDALKWTIDAHNAVNARLKKPVLTYAEAVKDMEDRCPSNVFGGVFGKEGLAVLSAAHAGQADAQEEATRASQEAQSFKAATIVLAAITVVLVILIIVGSTMKRKGVR